MRSQEYLTRADLFRAGHTRRSIQSEVRAGRLIHVRRDRYVPGGTHDALVRAVRVGGRLTCLSLLAVMGVFVLENRRLHVQVSTTASRLRRPLDRRRTLAPGGGDEVALHWSDPVDHLGASMVVSILDALVHAVRCQHPRGAVATIDSALNGRLIAAEQLGDLFAALPARFSALRPLIDGRAESGPETLVRLMARMLGCDVRLQVTFDGIGRVDLLIDGWLVVECDSKEFHQGWEAQARDRERDVALAGLGYATLRVTAAMVMYRPDDVFEALRGLVLSRRGRDR